MNTLEMTELSLKELNQVNGGNIPLEYWEALGDAIAGRNAATDLDTWAQYDSLVTSIWMAMKML